MRVPFFILLILSTSFLFSAEKEAPSGKRRPRIRIYDQEANLVPVAQPVDDGKQAGIDLDKKIRGEQGAPSFMNLPITGISLMPSVNRSNQDTSKEGEDEKKNSWVTPMDFLLEEDRIDENPDLMFDETKKDQPEEMEITDWETLQKSMIEDALKKKKPEISDEEMGEMLKGKKKDAQEKKSGGGLEMEAIAPLQEMDSLGKNLDSTRLPDALSKSEGFVPILQSARQMNGEIHRPGGGVSVQSALPGSSAMLNTLKEKWAKPADISSGSRLPGVGQVGILPRESLMSRRVSEPSGLQSFAASNPALRPLPDVKPAIREPVKFQSAAPQIRNEPKMLQREDYRIRSSLGVPHGL